jgi:hypothetical protein
MAVVSSFRELVLKQNECNLLNNLSLNNVTAVEYHLYKRSQRQVVMAPSVGLVLVLHMSLQSNVIKRLRYVLAYEFNTIINSSRIKLCNLGTLSGNHE